MTVTAEALPKSPMSPGLRLAVDFGPLLLFFLANMLAPVPAFEKIFVATGVFMLATIAAMIASRIAAGAISPMLWFNGAMVVVFGGATLWLHDETFIKVKPTIYYVMLAAILFFGLWRRRPVLKLVLGAAYPNLTDRGWQLLSRNWALFFVAMAIANEAVRRLVSTDLWVAYKLWVVFPATIVFAIANVPMLMRHGMNADAGKDELGQVPPEG